MPPPAYPLAALLKIRLFREDGARRAVRQAERRLEEAGAEIVRRREELERYREWMPREADRRYAAIMGRPISPDGLSDFRASLSDLEMGAQERAEAVRLAELEAEKRRGELEEARKAAAQARRDAARIEAHRDIWTALARKEAERREEAELEDFTPRTAQD